VEKRERERDRLEKLNPRARLNIDFNPFGNVQRNKISKELEKSAHKGIKSE
jgi:hypothetical protein